MSSPARRGESPRRSAPRGNHFTAEWGTANRPSTSGEMRSRTEGIELNVISCASFSKASSPVWMAPHPHGNRSHDDQPAATIRIAIVRRKCLTVHHCANRSTALGSQTAFAPTGPPGLLRSAEPKLIIAQCSAPGLMETLIFPGFRGAGLVDLLCSALFEGDPCREAIHPSSAGRSSTC
jgi:hypothetical protein